MTATRRAVAPERAGGSERRVDIQVLRGVAVLAVLLFHLWPAALPGGYVGVDVFFVISGFLITTQLLREIEGTGRVALAAFWARRARRLLPAALLVAAAALVGTLLFVPEAYWSAFLREVAASVLYVENWALALDAVDYLAAENSASPMQHYWSLSVEEQFYLLWPLLLLAAAALPLLRGRSARTRILIAIAAVVVVSLALSVLLTPASPGMAYFGTHVRAWQFGLGGLLAAAVPLLAGRLPRAARLALAWAGAAGIVAACLLFTGETEFPGSAALLPTAGAALVILGGIDGTAGGPGLGRFLLLDRLGDISYAVYLWHWPLVVIGERYAQSALSNTHLAVIGAVSILLGWTTTRFVEDPVRRVSLGRPGRIRLLLLSSLAAMALVVVPSLTLWAASREAAVESVEFAHAAVLQDPCLGAGSRDPAVDCSGWTPPPRLTPGPAYASEDNPPIYEDGCNAGVDVTRVISCVYGVSGAATRVALIGDSHANHWFPAVELLAEQRGWELRTFIHSSCPESSLPKPDIAGCDPWRAGMEHAVEEYGPFDLVFVSNHSWGNQAGDAEADVQGYLEVWQKYVDAGATIVVIEDTPRADEDVIDCVASAGDPEQDCRTERSRALGWGDRMVLAAERIPEEAVVIRTLDVMCPEEGFCDTIIGGVTVYRDPHHITATFAMSMAPLLRDRLEAALGALP